MADNEEDWFYDSISRYKNLNMFELEYPVYQMEPASSNSICVSCSNEKQHQLLELILPLKLTSQANNPAGGLITNDTDLKIRCGTFTTTRVAQMRFCASDRMVAASHLDKHGVTLYRLSTDDSDEIEKLSTKSCELKSPFLATNDTRLVLTKTSASPMFLLDIQSGLMISKFLSSEVHSEEELVSPVYVEPKVVALCNHSSGTVQLYDSRDSKVFNTNMVPGEKNSSWSFSSLYECSPTSGNSIQSTCLAMVSNKGVLNLYDSRNWNVPYFNKRLEVNPSNCSTVQLRFKPSNKCLMSVSGFDGNVYVYKLESEPELAFVHDGHRHVEGFTSETVTSSHLWFPNIGNLVISSAYNGTLQSWQFED